MDDPKVAELLRVHEEPIDSAAGLERFRAAARGVSTRPSWLARASRPLAVAAAVSVLLAGFAVTGVADSVFKIFEAKQVAPVSVTTADLAGLPSPSQFGKMRITQQPTVTKVASAAEAARTAGFAPLIPASVPARVPAAAEFSVISTAIGAFTFDASATPSMPAAIAGTTLTGTEGPAIVATYGGSFDTNTKSASTPPALVIARAKAPVVTSNGASLDELRTYLLAQPGVSPQLAAQIRAIGDPATTLPIIVPIDLGVSKPVTVRGAPGIFIGDSTGLGSGVIWLQDGFVNLVGGTLTESQILGVADSLR